MYNPLVDTYFTDGCGRCSLGGTPDCKVHRWDKELAILREIALSSGLNEELKWSVPCYTFGKKNIAIVGAFKEYATLSFFKGSLLLDEAKLLVSPGENSQSTRSFRFTDVSRILELEPYIKAYIHEAIELEKEGKKVPLKKTEEYTYPEELERKLEQDPALKKAFLSLTPGRQRGYLLYFSAAKQSSTREARIERSISRILEGKGINDL